ncbi:MAG: hypothetical protein JO083_06965 [Candidatus Eremiobacteraeota bacterium]|nr:hypothetical protein [Candidatus Eremiobacteraeota bacterium]
MRRAKLGAALCALAVVGGSALSALAQTAPAPQPAASALPIIGRTHSRGLCTTLRDNVAPMVLGMMKSDELVGAGHRALMKAGDDQRIAGRSGPRAALDLDEVYLRRTADAMAHNLGVIDKLLADEKRFPKRPPATDDERIAQQIKTQLQAVAAQQRAALNTLANALDQEDLGRMQNDFPTGLSAINSGPSSGSGALVNGTRGPDVDGSFIGVSGLIMPQKMTPPPAARGISSTRGNTVWDRLASAVEMHQAAISGAEQQLTPTIVALSVACRDELSPSPSPKP